MPHYSKTPALVIKSINYKDADKIITFFTKDLGKISAISRGIRKSKKREKANLELFTYSNIIIYGKGKQELYNLVNTELLKSFYYFSENENEISALFYLSQFIDQLLGEKIKFEKLFELVIEILFQIEKKQKIENLLYAFSLKALKEIGYEIQLKKCVKCNRNILEDFKTNHLKFSIKCGGVICDKCSSKVFPSFKTLRGTICLLYRLQTSKIEKINRLFFSKTNEEEFKKIIYPFIEFHLDVKLKSKEEIQEKIQLNI